MTGTDAATTAGRVRLGPEVRRLLVGVSAAAVGNGLTLPLLVVYLSQVRELPTTTAGLVLAWVSVIGLVLVPFVGSLVDRVGPRPVLVVGLLVEAAGVALLATVHTSPQAFAVGTLLAAGASASWAPQSALIGRLTRGPERQRAFGVQFMLLNLGIGVGGLVSAVVVDVARPGTFEVLYVVDALTYLVYVAVLLRMRGVGRLPVAPQAVVDGDDPGKPAVGPDDPAPVGSGGYREVLRDRRLVPFALVSLAMLTFGYGSVEVGIPLVTTVEAGLDVSWVGIAYAANTFTIVAVQLVVLRRIEGRSRSRLIALVALLWAGCWAVVALSTLSAVPLVAGLMICLATAVFAIGETIWSPVGPALTNDLAPEHLRGRYNAVTSLLWNASGALGPGVTAVLLGSGAIGLWAALVVGGCLLAGWAALGMTRVLTPSQDGRAVPGPVPG